MATATRSVKQIALQQMKEFLAVALYLWIVFSLLILFKSVVLAEQHIPFVPHGLALFNALALAKVMLVAKDLHVGERFNEAPLIYPTLLKSALFAVVLACFKILEEAAVGLYHGNSFQQSISHLGGGTLNGILVLTLLLFVVLIPFVGWGELQRILGEGKLEKLFFNPRSLLDRGTR